MPANRQEGRAWNGSTTTTCSTSGPSSARAASAGRPRSSASRSPPSAASCARSRTSSARSCSRKVGRRLVLTEVGRDVYRYADEIFSLGRELMDTVKGRPDGPADAASTSASPTSCRSWWRTACSRRRSRLPDPVRVMCREDSVRPPAGRARACTLDLVLSDAPVPPERPREGLQPPARRVRRHVLRHAVAGEALKRRFPASLDGAPLLLPTESTMLRRSLDAWLAAARHHAGGSSASSTTAR